VFAIIFLKTANKDMFLSAEYRVVLCMSMHRWKREKELEQIHKNTAVLQENCQNTKTLQCCKKTVRIHSDAFIFHPSLCSCCSLSWQWTCY